MQLSKGQKLPINYSSNIIVDTSFKSSFNNDLSCFCLNKDGKLISDDFMVFYNQTSSPNKEVIFGNNNFIFNLNVASPDVDKIVLCFVVEYGSTQNLSNVDYIKSVITTADNQYTVEFNGSDFSSEKAIMLLSFYRKDNEWRLNIMGQGFEGGLDSLVQFFGADVSQPQPAISNLNPKKDWLVKRLSLEKSLESTAPKLLDLSKKASISLEKKGLSEHKAKVALCLDISVSMTHLYSSGIIQNFVEKILALSCRFDDDGSIDIFLFGENGHQPNPITFKDFNGYISRIVKQYPLEMDTRYSEAIESVRQFYTKYKYERSEPLQLEEPVYVIFVTDGQPSDKTATTKAIKNSSYEPIFWQFIGVGSANLSYLEKLDDLPDRFLDNADFFKLDKLDKYSDEELYDKLINEYPSWINKAKGVLIPKD